MTSENNAAAEQGENILCVKIEWQYSLHLKRDLRLSQLQSVCAMHLVQSLAFVPQNGWSFQDTLRFFQRIVNHGPAGILDLIVMSKDLIWVGNSGDFNLTTPRRQYHTVIQYHTLPRGRCNLSATLLMRVTRADRCDFQ